MLGDTNLNYFPTEIEFDYQRQLSKRLPIVAFFNRNAVGYTAVG